MYVLENVHNYKKRLLGNPIIFMELNGHSN